MANNNDTPPPAAAVSPLIADAKDWAKGRKPADMCMELYVRLAEVTIILHSLSVMHGRDLAGQPADGIEAHPAPPPEILRQWLTNLLPKQGG